MICQGKWFVRNLKREPVTANQLDNAFSISRLHVDSFHPKDAIRVLILANVQSLCTVFSEALSVAAIS